MFTPDNLLFVLNEILSFPSFYQANQTLAIFTKTNNKNIGRKHNLYDYQRGPKIVLNVSC